MQGCYDKKTKFQQAHSWWNCPWGWRAIRFDAHIRFSYKQSGWTKYRIHEGLKTYKINLMFLIHKPKLLFGKNRDKSNHILESRSYVILVFPRAGTYHSRPGSKATPHAALTENIATMQWLHVASHVMLSLVSTHLNSAPRSFQYNMELQHNK